MSKVSHLLQKVKNRGAVSEDPSFPIRATRTPCMNCGKSRAAMILTPLYFDFDASLIPHDLRDIFVTREDGICVNCGLYQDFVRFDLKDMRRFLTFNKDETVSEGGFKSYPIPSSLIDQFNEVHVEQRINRWDQALKHLPRDSLRRCLFVRPVFGGTISYVRARFDCEIHALEISRACQRHILDHMPHVLFPEGQIHGIFELRETDRYDAIFVFHSLLHSIDVHYYLDNLVKALSSDGFILFSQEVQAKPQNPFHILFPSERILMQILRHHFSTVETIADCEPDPPSTISEMTENGDSPDFICRT